MHIIGGLTNIEIFPSGKSISTNNIIHQITETKMEMESGFLYETIIEKNNIL